MKIANIDQHKREDRGMNPSALSSLGTERKPEVDDTPGPYTIQEGKKICDICERPFKHDTGLNGQES